MPMPTTDTVDTMAVDTVDTTAEDTVMVDTDTVTIMARDLPKLNLLPITVMVDTDTAVDTVTVDTEDTVMADMVIMVDLFKKNSQLLKKMNSYVRIKSLEIHSKLIWPFCISKKNYMFFCIGKQQ